MGLYVLSYPGIAFSFPIHTSVWAQGKDYVSVLSSSTSHPAVSMAVFCGDSWPEARKTLYSRAVEPRKFFMALPKGKEMVKEIVPEDVRLIRIHGEGKLELLRPENTPPFWIKLGLTSPQELVSFLGPPDAIYRKNDQRLSIHKAGLDSRADRRSSSNDNRIQDDSTDTDQSSAHTATDDSEDENEDGEVAGSVSGECFYNYFYHGFDVLLSTNANPSQCPPSKKSANPEFSETVIPADGSKRLVASKVILHGNVPGSYPFNRHRRCRWEIEYLKPQKEKGVVNSETPFKELEKRLHNEWKSIYRTPEEARARQRGMVLNRDWGDSPGSSCELLGGWEDSVGGRPMDNNGVGDANGLGNTTLFGFPGLVFEVLKNDTVSGLTVF